MKSSLLSHVSYKFVKQKDKQICSQQINHLSESVLQILRFASSPPQFWTLLAAGKFKFVVFLVESTAFRSSLSRWQTELVIFNSWTNFR